jgi:hypothetical protein
MARPRGGEAAILHSSSQLSLEKYKVGGPVIPMVSSVPEKSFNDNPRMDITLSNPVSRFELEASHAVYIICNRMLFRIINELQYSKSVIWASSIKLMYRLNAQPST